ncbi:MAG: PilN domain-containing protein [Methylomonas sp.]|jgi:general secretion pathway protein L|uniref:PilN domain-containing protein n=1 Tax=Methylomonas sp. TaxID=418 RepID=UPI0025F813A0|nr:PilN domain-containing protein [Methylomonas sp.]MCK9605657.1 PilN domain-containing protein [Methylomonas sp.]
MNLDTTIDFDLKKFFQWWGGELAFLVPKGLRQHMRERHGSVIFTPLTQGFEVALLDDEENVVARRSVDLNQPGNFQLLKNQYPAMEKADIVLRLSAEQALHKQLYLPAAVQENLRQVVGFELDRYTPFNAEQVYFTLVSLGSTEHAQLRILLIAVPKPRLDEQLANLALLGVQPHKVDFAPAVADFPQTRNAYNLLPDRFRRQGSKLGQSLQWLVSAVLLLLLLAVMVWPVWREGQAVESLQTRIKQLEKQNRVVDQQQSEIDALHAETQKLIDIKQQSPALLVVLNELSRLLNDETWLTHLHFSDNHMQIQGQSPAASALISTLEGSEFFSDVSFVSPLTQDKTSGRERFQISMTVNTPVSTLQTDTAVSTDVPDVEYLDSEPEHTPEPEPRETAEELGDE